MDGKKILVRGQNPEEHHKFEGPVSDMKLLKNDVFKSLFSLLCSDILHNICLCSLPSEPDGGNNSVIYCPTHYQMSENETE